MRVSAVLLFAVAACTDAKPAVHGPLASASVALSDPALAAKVNGQLIVPDLVFEAIVTCPDCASQVISGSFGGTTFTGTGMYQPPASGAAVIMDRPPAAATSLALYTADEADGSITVTLPDGVFAPRTVTIEGGSTTLCPARTVMLDWSTAADMRGGQATVDWGVPTFCGAPSGCEGSPPPAFEVPSSVATTIAFTVPVPTRFTTTQNGVLTATPLATPDTGTAPCDAQACTYSVQHTAQTNASWAASCAR